ncbi:FHA domain-containing protein [Actinoplanes subtropicus]|uniref:FHA domain-containing protein n=1 Tax=Actinoplanes subtropicus TaxID=543632 RepID=UPI0004C3A8F5|nr:FHA domain-containing protein [Actinoplanes subtropicus]
MTTYACPRGHESGTDDFCDECGAKIGGATTVSMPVAAAPAAAPSAAVAAPSGVTPSAAPAGAPCPNCGAPRAGGSRFCEDCGYDHSTGKVPTLAPPPEVAAPVAAPWTATISADRKYFEDNAIEGVEFPADAPSREVDLPAPQVRIGRRSRSKGTNPEIDLADSDPGTSHSHALLTLSVDGVWLVSDLGSTNGTYVNEEQQPLGAGQTRSLKDGDQVHVGAWTTITLHAPAG